jgi:MoxR-like ATPase
MPETMSVDGVELVPATADDHDAVWLDYNEYVRQLEAAWLRLSPSEPTLTPRIVGEPGLGKTTLVCAVARRLGYHVYIVQCTMDTRPEDLLVIPVLTADQRVADHASPLVTAMLCGGVALLDEGNRMPERSWASVAPLMDDRRYVESTAAAITIQAQPRLRLCVMMNQDASVYELAGYVQSRLHPRIEIVAPPWEQQRDIVRVKCAAIDDALLGKVFALLKDRVAHGQRDSTRDILTLAQYAQNLQQAGLDQPLQRAAGQILSPSHA